MSTPRPPRTRYGGRRLPTHALGWIGDVVLVPSRRFRKHVVHYAFADGRERSEGYRSPAGAEAFRQRFIRSQFALPSHGEKHLFEEALAIAVSRRKFGDQRTTARSRAKQYISPIFGRLEVHEITDAHYAEFLESIAHLSPGYVKGTRHLFHLALEVAKSEKWLDPGFVLKAPRPRRLETRMQRSRNRLAKGLLLPSREELNILRARATGYMRVLVYLAIHAGLRFGEIIALEWGDIDFRKGMIRVRATVVRGPDSEVKPPRKPPKTKDGNRSIPIDDELLPILEEWAKQWPGADKDRPTDDRVLCPPGTMHLGYTTIGRAFHRLLHDLGMNRIEECNGRKSYVGGFTIHTLRHSCVALWIWAEIDREQIRMMIGHASVKTTIWTYGYLIKARRAGNRSWPTGRDTDVEPTTTPGGSRLVTINGRRHRFSASSPVPSRRSVALVAHPVLASPDDSRSSGM